MKYYLKKCGLQELGSVSDGKVNRGRYLYISINSDILSMFPALSETELNDSAILPIIPLYSGKKVYCSFIYHNSKIVDKSDNGRNEYRIYLNNALEEETLLFKPNDIVIIRQEEVSDEKDVKQTVYLLDLLQDHTTSLYRRLNEIIEATPIRGGHGLIDGEIPEFEEKAARLNQTTVSNIVIDKKVVEQIASQKEAMADLFNASSFRDFVLVGYNFHCAVTGTVIRYDNYMNLEAAHIWPRSHGGLFLPSNGIALCRDLHWAFDKGFFTLNEKYEVVLHEKIESEYLKSFNGKKIYLPQDDFFQPSLDGIRFHKENVFGLFLTSGRL